MRALYLILFTAISCSSNGISVDHYALGRTYLPSTFVRSPDPLQAEDFKGEMILISYNLPQEVFEETPALDVRLLFKNLTERSFTVLLSQSKGVERLEIVQEEFEQHGPILGYCVTCGKLKVESPVYANIITIDGKSIAP